MIAKARLSLGPGAALVAGGALVAAATGASASDTLPTPDPPHLVSATVTGCQAPCKIGQSGEVVLEYKLPPLPPGSPSDARLNAVFYANGFRITDDNETFYDPSTGALGIGFPICASDWSRPDCYPKRVDRLRGNETMTATDFEESGNPDIGTEQFSAESAPSNGLVPTQG